LPCFALVIPLCSIPAAHTAKHYLSQARAATPQSFHSTSSIAFFRRAGTCLARKKTSLHGKKNAPALRVPRRQPQPSFRYATLRAIRGCHPRSTRRQLAPLHYAGKNHSATLRRFFYLLRSGSRLFYLRCFLPPHANPRPPTPKNSCILILFALPRRLRNCHFANLDIFPEKKKYAKLAISLTGCKGHALRVFQKIFLFISYAALK
jgi:hypothetical protein